MPLHKRHCKYVEAASEPRERLLKSLRVADQFHGARHELMIASCLVRAGFTIEFSDEADSTRRHGDATAMHRQTGRSYSVEMKAKGRPGVLGHLGVHCLHQSSQLPGANGRLLYRAGGGLHRLSEAGFRSVTALLGDRHPDIANLFDAFNSHDIVPDSFGRLAPSAYRGGRFAPLCAVAERADTSTFRCTCAEPCSRRNWQPRRQGELAPLEPPAQA